MSWKTPSVEDGYLVDSNNTCRIVLDSPDWFAWLEEDCHHAFHFEDTAGKFTARKERKQRGQWYWVAYRQVHKKLYKSYLGKSETLTQVHLHDTSEALTHLVEAKLQTSATTPKHT